MCVYVCACVCVCTCTRAASRRFWGLWSTSPPTYCNALQHTVTRWNRYSRICAWKNLSSQFVLLNWRSLVHTSTCILKRLVGSLKWQVSAEYPLFHRALLQKRPIILRSLLIVATPYTPLHTATQCDVLQRTVTRCNTLQHVFQFVLLRICALTHHIHKCTQNSQYMYIYT